MYRMRQTGSRCKRRGFATPAALAGVFLVALLAGCKPGGPSGPEGSPNSPEPEAERFSITLEWNAPTEDARGEPLDDLLGYRIHYRDASPANGSGAAVHDVGDTTRTTVDELPAGTWFFGVTARDVSGNESAMSNEVRIEVGP